MSEEERRYLVGTVIWHLDLQKLSIVLNPDYYQMLADMLKRAGFDAADSTMRPQTPDAPRRGVVVETREVRR